jgi:drug/metabolite transporter (DMT)-like permease
VAERALAGRPAAARPLAAVALVTALALVWGVNWPVMKRALTEVDVWSFRAVCAAGAGLVFLGLLKLSGRRLYVPPAERGPLVVAALLNITLWPLASVIALTMYPAGASAIVAYTMPAIAAAIGSVALKERFTARRVAALALGMAGLAALMAPTGVTPGAAWMLGGAVIWALGMIQVKRIRWTIATSTMSAWQTFIGGAPALALALLLGDWARWAEVSPVGAASIAYSALLSAILGHWLWFRMVGLFPIAVTGVSSLAVPVVGVLSGALLLGERIGPAELIALALVVPAIALVLFERRPK